MDTTNPSALQTLLQEIDRLQSEIDQLRPLTAEQEARVMQKFRLDWNYHSNSIEGNSLTYGETIAFLMEGLTAKGKPFKDHLDLKGHNEGIDYLMDVIKNGQFLTEKMIRELHGIILVEPYKTNARTPDGQVVKKTVNLGQYKKQPNHVQTPTGETHYYATPEETPALMGELMAWLKEHQEKADLHPLVLAAVFHYRFVAIHPFDDGNGRMARMLMNLLLMQYHFPPVVIKIQDRNAYYYALRQADSGNIAAFIDYIGENLLHSMTVYLSAAQGKSIEESGDWEKQVDLLKKSAEGKNWNSKPSRKNRKEDLAKWLELNFPILWNEFEKRFNAFVSFFNSAGCSVYTYYRHGFVGHPLPPEDGSWREVAAGFIDGDYQPTITFLFHFRGFIYAPSEMDTPFQEPKILLSLDRDSIQLESNHWAISPVTALTPEDLQPIRDLAQQFYSQIEEALKR